MPLFSERHTSVPKAQITDEAPQWLRVIFFNQILTDVLYLDRSSAFSYGSDNSDNPIGIKWLVERIAVLTRTSPPKDYLYDAHCLEALKMQMFSIEWLHFFDVVEIAHSALSTEDASYGSRLAVKFRDKTNSCFVTGGVAWRLDSIGKLHRVLPDEVEHLERALASSDQSDSTATHIAKAKRFLDQRPCDAANSIKESVSAVESLARTIVPGSSTLGDAVTHLRKKGTYPAPMLTLIEKLYGFANSEPGVRHGSPEDERVRRVDAEFAYVTSLAIVRYLKEIRN